jgi:serine/threonine protein kinase
MIRRGLASIYLTLPCDRSIWELLSLGVILYELMTGRQPFQGPMALVVGLIMVAEPEPPSRMREGVDPRIEAICARAMAKKVPDRYPSMAHLASALAEYLASREPGPQQPHDEVPSAPPDPPAVVSRVKVPVEEIPSTRDARRVGPGPMKDAEAERLLGPERPAVQRRNVGPMADAEDERLLWRPAAQPPGTRRRRSPRPASAASTVASPAAQPPGTQLRPLRLLLAPGAALVLLVVGISSNLPRSDRLPEENIVIPPAPLISDKIAEQPGPARPDARKDPAPVPSLRLDVPKDLGIDIGSKQVFAVGIDRRGPIGPVDLRFEGLPENVVIPQATVPAEEVKARIEVEAGPNASSGAWLSHPRKVMHEATEDAKP